MSTIGRILRHLFTPSLAARRGFPPASLQAIEAAVRSCESRHAGEIRFAVESDLPLFDLLRGVDSRARAIELFSRLRVWDTEHNNGVLIYVLLADRRVEIVADRGIAGGGVAQAEWDTVCRLMEGHFRGGAFEAGALAGVEAVADVLARHPAGVRGTGNELPDAPVLIR